MQDENWELKCEKRTLLLDQEKQEASLKLALANARKKEQEVRANSMVAYIVNCRGQCVEREDSKKTMQNVVI